MPERKKCIIFHSHWVFFRLLAPRVLYRRVVEDSTTSTCTGSGGVARVFKEGETADPADGDWGTAVTGSGLESVTTIVLVIFELDISSTGALVVVALTS